MKFDHDSERIQLRDLLLQKSVRFGDFTLASGQKSNVYADGKLTTMQWKQETRLR